MSLASERNDPAATAIAGGVDSDLQLRHHAMDIDDDATDLPRRSYVPTIQSSADFARETVALLGLDTSSSQRSRSAQGAPTAIPLRWHGEADPHADRAWLIRGILPEQGKGLLAGQWGTAKTFTALDLSGAVMSGMAFAGHKVERRGGVLFVAAEGAFEVPIRIRGLVDGKLRTAPTARGLDMDRLPFTWVEECPRLVEAGALAQLQATATAAAARFRAEFDLPLSLIVIDTLAAAAGFEDENSASETQRVMNLLQALSASTGAFVLGVDHFGKSTETGTRGSSAKEAAADAVLAMLGEKDVTGTVSNLRMAVRKVRGARCGFEIPLALEVQQLGETDDGEPVTSCFIAWTPREAPTRSTVQVARWPTALRTLHRAIGNALAEKGRRIRPFGIEGPEVTGISEPDIRAEFAAAYPADGETDRLRSEAKRKAFKRSLKNALDQGLVVSRDVNGVDLLWLPN